MLLKIFGVMFIYMMVYEAVSYVLAKRLVKWYTDQELEKMLSYSESMAEFRFLGQAPGTVKYNLLVILLWPVWLIPYLKYDSKARKNTENDD